jgi:hypothetical protein
MRFLMLLVLLFPLVMAGAGCSGEKPPKRDPNYPDTSDPRNVPVPDAIKKPGAPAQPNK